MRQWKRVNIFFLYKNAVHVEIYEMKIIIIIKQQQQLQKQINCLRNEGKQKKSYCNMHIANTLQTPTKKIIGKPK